jgi:hypothetical protein
MKTSTILLFCFGCLVLIFIQYKAFQEHTLYNDHKNKQDTKKVVENSYVLQTLQNSSFLAEKKIIENKVAIFLSFDYDIEFKSLSNSDKIDKLENITKNVLKFTTIKKIKNNLNALKTLLDILTELNNSTTEKKETLVFIWIASICTKVWGKNGPEGGICLGNEILSEKDFKDMFLKYSNISFICGFEPCNDIFYPKLQVYPKSNLIEEPFKKHLFTQNSITNQKIIPINYKYILEKQKYPLFEFHELSNFVDYSMAWNFEMSVEKSHPLDKFVWCFSSVNLTNIFCIYYQLAGPFLGLQSIMGYFEKQKVQQSFSRVPAAIENIFQVA